MLKRWLSILTAAVLVLCLAASPGLAETYLKLQRGDSSDAVALMQNAFRVLGYSVTADGKYGASTEAAVRAFQKMYGLTVDGVAGQATLEKLHELTGIAVTGPSSSVSAVTAAPTAAASTSVYTKLQLGSTGSAVKSLQLALISLGYQLTADGIYGTGTRAAVRTFQRSQGLSVDGIAGSATQRRLYELAYASTVTAVPTAAPTPTPTPALTTAPSGTAQITARVTTSGGGLNLRAYASETAQVLTVIPNHTTLSVLSYGSVWSQVNYGTYYGYVKTSFLTVIGNVTAVPTAAPATATPYVVPSAAARVKTGGGSLNLRLSPSGSARVLTQIPNNTVITMLSWGSTWSMVAYGSYTGYVMTSFLSTSAEAAATPAPTSTPTAAPVWSGEAVAIVTTSGGALNLRREASQSSSVITTIPNGSYLQISSYASSWCSVFYNGYSGYVMTRFLTVVSRTTVSPQVTAAPAYVTAEPTAVPTAAPTSTASYDTSVFSRTLRSGYTGTDVLLLQQRLSALDYLAASDVSGTYDSATMTAVRQFQTVHGLSVDGLAGAKTFSILFSSAAISYTSDVSSYTTLHIYYQSVDTTKTSAVQKMQTRLKELGYTCNVTGIFDETTYMAVIAFQLRNGVTVTGAADAATQSRLYSSSANGPASAASLELEAGAGYISGPSTSQLQLLHWYNSVKPSLSSGATLLIYDPTTHLSWNLRLMSSGRHADCEPKTLRDTLIMFRALGKPSWTVHVIYVQLPDGRWTMATMHDRPHLTGTLTNNGFDGHLCVHFLRDMDEAKQNDPNYGVTNQNTLRDAWKALTGETVYD